MNDCLFCKISEKKIPAEIIYEDEQCIAFKDVQPKADTHFLVIPRKHIKHLADLKAEDSKLISHMMLTLPEIALSQGLKNGFRTVANTGEGGGQEIYHLHFHILGGALKSL